MKVKNLLAWIGVVALVAVLAMMIHPFGLFNFNGSVDVRRQDTMRTDGISKVWTEARNLHCSSLINASVPVKGQAQYTVHLLVASKTLNTDGITMRAIGDVGGCLRARFVKLIRQGGEVIVTLDASGTSFWRPRVKPAATAGSVKYHRGFMRGLIAAMPMPLINLFIDENSSQLTMQAESFAQSVIGGSKCMKAAWPQAKRNIVTEYRRTLTRLGFDTAHLQVRLVGQPDFAQNDLKHAAKVFGNTKFKIDHKHVVCRSLPAGT